MHASELCERLNDSVQLFPVLFGSWLTRLLRGEYRIAYELAEDLMRRAQIADDPTVLLYAHHPLGQTLCHRGDLPAGHDLLQKAVSLYDPAVHSALTSHYAGIDAKVYCQGIAAFNLWLMGYSEQAITSAQQMLAWVRQLSHPYSLAFAEYLLSDIHHEQQRDPGATQERAEEAIALCAEYGLSDFAAFMTIKRGWAIAQQGHSAEGIRQIRDALETLRERGTKAELPHDMCKLAEAYVASGKLDDALSALSEALTEGEKQENRRYEAEVSRLIGELLQRDLDATRGAQYFQSAIEIARRQSAKSYELRATTSLARLRAKQARRGEARDMLADIYNWFTEGFDTADLKDARALLDELNG
jgi:predicted ATPase